jgi:hypothetical protein
MREDIKGWESRRLKVCLLIKFAADRFAADRFAADRFVADRVLRLADLWLATGPLVIRNSATAKDPPRQPEILDQSTVGIQVETYCHELTLL